MEGISRIWNPQSRDKNLPFIITPYQDGSGDQDQDQDFAPPPPPPKDPGYRGNNSPYGSAGFGQPSQSSLLPPKATPNTPNTPAGSRWQNLANVLTATQKMGGGFISPSSSQVSLAVPGAGDGQTAAPSVAGSASAGSKFNFKLPKLKRKPSRTLAAEISAISTEEEASTSTSSHLQQDGDESISSPWGFKHRVHVDGSLTGLPTEWAETLQKSGYSVEEIRAIYAKHRKPLPTSPRPPAPPSKASSSSQPLGGPNPDDLGPVNPRPRKDSIKHLERSLSRKAGHNIKVIIPDPSMDDGDVTIAVATPVRRSPSTLRRLQAPDWPEPPGFVNSDQTPSQHLAPTKIPAPPEKSNNGLGVDSPEKSTGKLRQAIHNTLTHARSTASLRKVSADGPSTSSAAPPPPPLPSSSSTTPSTPPRTISVRKRKSEGPRTFWEDDESDGDESSDIVSPLPVGMRSPSTKSPRITSTLPPRLELNLPFDDASSVRKNSGESAAPSLLTFSTSSLTPKPTSATNASFVSSIDFDGGGLDLGLGDWGSELLAIVSSGSDNRDKATASRSTDADKGQVLTIKHSSQSSTIASPTSVSTMFSTGPTTSSQSSHLVSVQRKPTLTSISSSDLDRPISLFPVVPLTLPAHKTKPQPAIPPSSAETSPASQTAPTAPTTTTVEAAPRRSSSIRAKRVSKIVVNNGKIENVVQPSTTTTVNAAVLPDVPESAVSISPSTSMENIKGRRPEALTSNALGNAASGARSQLPPPSSFAPPKQSAQSAQYGRQLSMFIREEEDMGPIRQPSLIESDDGLLPYMKGTPAATQTKFSDKALPNPAMSQSTSTSASDSSSYGTMDSSIGGTSVTSAGSTVDYPGSRSTIGSVIGKVMAGPLPLSPSASSTGSRPYSSLTVTQAGYDRDTASPSRPVSNIPYDAVLDDYLNEDDDNMTSGHHTTSGEEEQGGVKKQPEVPPIPTTAKSPRGQLAPQTPSISVNGNRVVEGTPGRDSTDDEDSLPLILAPLASRVHRSDGSMFSRFQQVAEGQYGLVYAAKSADVRQGDPKASDLIALKVVHVTSSNQPKFTALQNELKLLEENVRHENVLAYDGVYLVDAQSGQEVNQGTGLPMLWLEMELMERSLADILAFVPEGLVIEESHIAKFANDVLEGLDYLQGLDIAHRDVRSDNLLVSRTGLLKLADFSSATMTSKTACKRRSTQGQPPYWMAPEMRRGQAYDPHEADIWSVGATVWEVAQGDPPFIEVEDPRKFLDQLPELDEPERFSEHFHDFLRLCGQDPGQRPRAVELLRTPFVKSASSPAEIVRLLAQVRRMEDEMKQQ
ncbi:hypothetical protein FRC04_002232 [Tulasnella sp. 424]|nr:hypothetical protein FRC04_002232 [Tulasnella sp. 424]KAG8969710.1 hypothetical protein FRC05_000841 [Tulasnella sp. 425]